MAIFKILLWGRSAPEKRRPTVIPSRQKTAGIPIRWVRRRFLLRGAEYGVTLKPEAVRNGLTVKDDQLIVSLNPATHENFELFMENWYRRQARKAFQGAVDRWLPLFHAAGHDVPAPRIKIFSMRRAWGRCYYTKGLITMNVHLVKTPQRCIDYIVLHELCHFVVHNHSKTFYGLVAAFMPEWREADKHLKAFAREHKVIR